MDREETQWLIRPSGRPQVALVQITTALSEAALSDQPLPVMTFEDESGTRIRVTISGFIFSPSVFEGKTMQFPAQVLVLGKAFEAGIPVAAVYRGGQFFGLSIKQTTE